MLVGAFHFPTDYGIEVSELAHALEARGFESLFVCEHTHIPVSRRSPYPGGGELPKRFLRRGAALFQEEAAVRSKSTAARAVALTSVTDVMNSRRFIRSP